MTVGKTARERLSMWRRVGKGSDSALVPEDDNLPRMAQIVRNRWLRVLYVGLGFLSLGIGIVGTVLPGIPTTMPILLAAFFFSKSSQRFDDWLVNHKVFGPLVRDWRAGRGFTARAKAVALIAIAVTFTITVVWAVDHTAVRVGLILLALGVSTYILSLPTKRLERV
jgi:uncharacterized membrane protein YbaN (DUF454 family)